MLVVCNRMQQLHPIIVGPSCTRVGLSREVIASLFPRRPCVMRMRGPNNVGRAVQTDPTLLRYASAITEQKKCWELLAQKFDRFQTLSKNSQQHATTYNRVCNGS